MYTSVVGVFYSIRQQEDYLNAALNELRLAYARAHELCGPLFELEAAIEYLKELAAASKQAKQELEEGSLYPLPGTVHTLLGLCSSTVLFCFLRGNYSLNNVFYIQYRMFYIRSTLLVYLAVTFECSSLFR